MTASSSAMLSRAMNKFRAMLLSAGFCKILSSRSSKLGTSYLAFKYVSALPGTNRGALVHGNSFVTFIVVNTLLFGALLIAAFYVLALSGTISGAGPNVVLVGSAVNEPRVCASFTLTNLNNGFIQLFNQ